MTDYAAILTSEYPDREWSISGEDYDTLQMLDGKSKPSKATLDGKWAAVQRKQAIEQVRAIREEIYRRETDRIFFQAMREEGSLTLEDWKTSVQAVKDAHPWPE
jgi:hypothetical protein